MVLHVLSAAGTFPRGGEWECTDAARIYRRRYILAIVSVPVLRVDVEDSNSTHAFTDLFSQLQCQATTSRLATDKL